jgi:hypothetical protein
LEIQPHEAAEAAYHRLARLEQQVVLALLKSGQLKQFAAAFRRCEFIRTRPVA